MRYQKLWISIDGYFAVRNENGKIKPYSKKNFIQV